MTLALYAVSTQFSRVRVRRCKRIKWVWIFEILSLFWALFLFAQSSTSAFRIGCHWYTHGWCSSASSSCQPPGNWYNVRHNLFHIHSSLKRIPFRVGLSLAALQFSIGWHANKVSCEWKSFWKCWFSSYKKVCAAETDTSHARAILSVRNKCTSARAHTQPNTYITFGSSTLGVYLHISRLPFLYLHPFSIPFFTFTL